MRVMLVKKRYSWNKNFILLCQGQSVSSFCDAIYTIALNFYVFNETKSTTLMSLIIAITTIPRIVLGPFIGTIIDRSNRKHLIVCSDVIRGLTVLFIAAITYNGIFDIRLVLLSVIISGICTSFFNPTVETILPEISYPIELSKTMAIYQMITTGFYISGNLIGGLLYTKLKTQDLFFINGCSYLFSAVTELFIKLQPFESELSSSITFGDDIKNGLSFISKSAGLMRIVLMSFFINFIFGIIRVSLISWFSEPLLGVENYGILNGVCSAGMIVGMLILSIYSIDKKYRYRCFLISLFGFIFLIGISSRLSKYLYAIFVLFLVAFIFQFVFNNILTVTLISKTPKFMQGKVLATRTALVLMASPIGNIIAGKLCEFIAAENLILISSVLAATISFFTVIHSSVREFFDTK